MASTSAPTPPPAPGPKTPGDAKSKTLVQDPLGPGVKTVAAQHPVAEYDGRTETVQLTFRGHEKGGNRTFNHPEVRASAYFSKGFFKNGFVIPRNARLTLTMEVPVGEDRVFANETDGPAPVQRTYTAEQLAEAKAKLAKAKAAAARRTETLARQEEQLNLAAKILDGESVA